MRAPRHLPHITAAGAAPAVQARRLFLLALFLIATCRASDEACDWAGPRVDCGEFCSADRPAGFRGARHLLRSETLPMLRRHAWRAANHTPCPGHVGITASECENKGCCWNPASFADFPPVNLPWCFTANAHKSEYTVVGRADEGAADWGVRLFPRGMPVQQQVAGLHCQCRPQRAHVDWAGLTGAMVAAMTKARR